MVLPHATCRKSTLHWRKSKLLLLLLCVCSSVGLLLLLLKFLLFFASCVCGLVLLGVSKAFWMLNVLAKGVFKSMALRLCSKHMSMNTHFSIWLGWGGRRGWGGRQDKYLVEIGLNNVKLVLTVIADLTHTHTHTHTHTYRIFSRLGRPGQFPQTSLYFLESYSTFQVSNRKLSINMLLHV